MNKQIFSLMRLILQKEGQSLSVNEVKKRMNISSRSIYNYWNEISQYLHTLKYDFAISFDGRQFILDASKESRSFLIKSISSLSFYEYKLSPEERKLIVLVMLLNDENGVNFENIENQFFVSKSTLVEDIKTVKTQLADCRQNIIVETVNNRIKLIADEKGKRSILISIFEKLNNQEGLFYNVIFDPCISYLLTIMKFEKYKDIAEDTVSKVERKMDLEIPDRKYYEIVCFLSIIMGRIESGQLIIEPFKQTETDQTVDYFSQEIFKLIGINDPNEINFFVEVLDKHGCLKGLKPTEISRSFISILVKDFLNKIQPYYSVNLADDDILTNYLESHVLSCYQRCINKDYIDNPYLQDIKSNYLKDFEFVKAKIFVLENGLNISIGDSEIAYILMHIIATVERMSQKNNSPHILIVCSTGIATGHLVSSQLEKQFGVSAVGIVAVHQVNEYLRDHKIDIIITTVPLDVKNVKVILVNAFLTSDSISVIKGAISSFENINNEMTYKSNHSSFDGNMNSNYFNIDTTRVSFINSAANWQEAIIKAGELLLFNGYIAPAYMQQMVKLVSEFGPYIVISRGIAFAHANPDAGVIHPGMAVVRLDQGVNFGKTEFDPVRIVIACATDNSDEFTTIFLKMITRLRKPLIYENLLSAETKEEIADILNAIINGSS